MPPAPFDDNPAATGLPDEETVAMGVFVPAGLSPGEILTHYEIVQRIGEGGMGVVYKAVDRTLGRTVAIKTLPEDRTGDAAQRFLREARLVSALNHPNIVTIYEAQLAGDIPFIAMEYVTGVTLTHLLRTQPPGVARTIEIARQICSALSHAHQAGIVHRDLKPANTMLTADGSVKVLDFGLAKKAATDDKNRADATALTGAGFAIGTLSYMSPEQAVGDEVDGRSDIFSLGLILYEMLTLQRPFAAPTTLGAMRALVHSNPRPLREVAPQVPPSLEEVVMRCLEKNPDQRYQTATEVASALERVDPVSSPSQHSVAAALQQRSAAPHRRWLFAGIALTVTAAALGAWTFRERLIPGMAPHPITIAVLPFENLTADPKNDYIGDGIAEEISDWLGKSRDLRVISRDSTMQFRGSHETSAVIGRKLRADWLIGGTLRVEGSLLRVRLQVVQASDGTQKLSMKVDRDLKDELQLEEQIGGSLAALLNVRLSHEGDQLEPETRNLYWLAAERGRQQSPAALRASIQMMEEVAKKAPNNALPVIQLAFNYGSLAAFSGGTPDDAQKARQYMRRALQLGGNLPTAHTAAGFVKSRLDWDWNGAEKEFQAANANGHGDVGYATLLMLEGRLDEAKIQLDQAQALDPLSYQVPHTRSLVFLFGGSLRDAERENTVALSLMPRSPPRLWRRGQIESLLGRSDEALQNLRMAVETAGTGQHKGALGWALVRAGQKEEANRLLSEVTADPSLSPIESARLLTGLGEVAPALDWLDKAYAAHDPLLDGIWMDPIWKPLRGNPRYMALVGKVFSGVKLNPPPNY